jgi:hypothetical protein
MGLIPAQPRFRRGVVYRSDESRWDEVVKMKRFAQDDSGVVLVAVMGVIALMTVISVGAYAASSQALTETQLADKQHGAFSAADAGVQVAVGKVQDMHTEGSGPRSLETTGSFNGNSYVVKATYTSSGVVDNKTYHYYSVESVGTSDDGTRRESVTASLTVQPATPPPISEWGFMLTNGSFNNSKTWNGAMHGKLAIRFPEGAPGTAYLGNSQNSNSDVDWQDADLYLWNVKSIVWSKVNSSGSTLVPITTNLPVTQVAGDKGKVVGGTPNVIGGSAPPLPVMNDTYYQANHVWDYTGDLTFGEKNQPENGTNANFSYNGSTGVLTLNGTIYVDGAVIFKPPPGKTAIHYVGNGTIATAPGHQIEFMTDVVPNTPLHTPDKDHVMGFATDTFIKCFAPCVEAVGAFYAGQYITVPTPGKIVGTVIAGAATPVTGDKWGIVAYDTGAVNNGKIPDLVLDDLDWSQYLPAGMPRAAATSSTESGPMVTLQNWRRL